jgi:hypothetical protein
MVVCLDCGRERDALRYQTCPWCDAVNRAQTAMQRHLAICSHPLPTCEEHARLHAILTDLEAVRCETSGLSRPEDVNDYP